MNLFLRCESEISSCKLAKNESNSFSARSYCSSVPYKCTNILYLKYTENAYKWFLLYFDEVSHYFMYILNGLSGIFSALTDTKDKYAHSDDLDQKPHSVVSDQVLQCKPMFHIRCYYYVDRFMYMLILNFGLVACEQQRRRITCTVTSAPYFFKIQISDSYHIFLRFRFQIHILFF